LTASVRESENNQNSANSASLKGKIQTIDDTISNTQDEVNSHKKDVNLIKTERDALQDDLKRKIESIRKSLFDDISKIELELNSHFNNQKSENNKLIMELNKLKNEKTELQKTLICNHKN